MRRVVILGGGGVFGVHTAKYFLGLNVERVVSVGRNPEKSPAFTLNVGLNDPRYRYEQVHITYEPERLLDLLDAEKPDTIVNFAAQAHGPSSWTRSYCYYETNCVALVHLCEELTKRDYLQRFIQIGTSELYGPVVEPASEDAPLKPTSPYAISKLAFDLHLTSLWRVGRFPMNIIRPSNAYGPGQAMHRILPRAVLCALTGQKLTLDGGGASRKSYIHAIDLAGAIMAVRVYAEPGRIYNAGPALPISIYDLVAVVADQAGIAMDDLCTVGPARRGEDAQYWLDSSRIAAETGWKPTVALEDGIAGMLDWGRKHLDVLQAEPATFTLRG